MKLAAWKRMGIAVGLAVSLVVLPMAAPLKAQQPGAPQTERAVDTDDDFPWGLLGLLGLIGLAGLRRRPVVDRRSTTNPTQRRP
jgi:MYXO-CTERM domain-containing protein